MHWIIIGLIAIALYVAYIYFLFVVSAYLFPVGCAVLIGAVLFNYLSTMWREMIVGTGWNDSPVGNEPAFRQYYFRKAYHDYAQVVDRSWALNKKVGEWVIYAGKKLFTNGGVLFTWPLGVAFFALAAAGALAGGIAYALFGLIHLLLVLLCAAIAMSLAGLSRLAEYASMTWRRIFLVCPKCYRPITLPVYVCPNCGVTHSRLLPGSYGIFRRVCKCTARLPTLFIFGRNKLPSFCPHHTDCGQPLNSIWGVTRNLHVPIVGGPASGKTSFLMASMCELHELAKSGVVRIGFPEKKDETLFDRCRKDFLHGTIVDKTAEHSPSAFLVDLETSGSKSLLYIYDAAGELYQHTQELARHEYYSYTHGIVFLLDPFSLPQVQTDYASSLKSSTDQVKPCAEMPQDVYDRMIGTLRAFSNNTRSFRSIPFAVVMTKGDAFGIAKTIKGTPANSTSGVDSNEDVQSAAVRQWLINNNESNLVRSIENDFKKVCYFHCSSLGRLPDNSSSPFNPRGVLDPLGWVLKPYNVRFDGQVQGSSSASTSASSQPAYRPSIGGKIYSGAVISVLWVFSILGLFGVGGLLVINATTSGFRSSSPAPVEYQAPAPIVDRFASTTTDVNLRAEANKTSRKVGLAEYGSRVRILNIAADGIWYEVQVIQHGRPKEAMSSDRGWLNSTYLMID